MLSSRFRCWVLISLCFSSIALGQWNSIGDVSSFKALSTREIEFVAENAKVRLTVLTDGIVRVRMTHQVDFAPDSSWAVIEKHWPDTHPEIVDKPEKVTISAGQLSIVVSKRPLRISFLDNQGTVLNADHPSKGMAWSGKEVRVWKTMPENEFYFGFGEKAGRLQKKFTSMTMWNSDIPAYGADTDPLYQTIPFFYGIRNGKAYGIFFDNTYRSSFDMGKEARDQFSFGAEAGELNYYFFPGPSPADVLRKYTELVGTMPLPPRWSLGYQQCRWSYPSEKRVREIADGFRTRKIPCDVIYLDIDYMDGYRIFTWNTSSFPNPKGLISDLKGMGFRTAVIVDPGIKIDEKYHAYQSGLKQDVFLKKPDGTVYNSKVWPGECAFPDFTDPAARTWWGNSFESLVADGVRGWWNDMNEPSVFDVPSKTIDLNVIHQDNGLQTTHAKNHNVYGMQMTRATYDGVRRLLPNERPFVLTRASYAGGQRYSAAWTGDNVSSWEHLRMGVSMCLNLSISGQPFVGSDIGGFIGYPSGELFARWLQLGVFTPLMRAHSVINENNKEPWEYGDEFTNANRETINLRYTLLPLIYNLMYEASQTGIPAMRPMLFEYPEEQAFTWTDNQFMFGSDLVVAPVVSEGVTSRTVQLPQGVWFDFWSNQRYSGGKEITVEAPLNRIPVFVKEGAIIPTQPVVQHTDERPDNPVTFSCYPTSLQSTRMYYEDDGISFEYEGGKYSKRSINQWRSSKATTVTLSKKEGTFATTRTLIFVQVIGINNEPLRVDLSGREISQATTGDTPTQWWSYDDQKKIVTICAKESPEAITIRVTHN